MLSKCTKPKSLYVPNLYTGYSHISVSLSLIMLFPMHGLINIVFQISHLFTELHCLPQLHFVLFNNTITFKKQHLTKKITWRLLTLICPPIIQRQPRSSWPWKIQISSKESCSEEYRAEQGTKKLRIIPTDPCCPAFRHLFFYLNMYSCIPTEWKMQILRLTQNNTADS